MTGTQSVRNDIVEAERYGVSQALIFTHTYERPWLLDKDAHVFGLPKMPEDEENKDGEAKRRA